MNTEQMKKCYTIFSAKYNCLSIQLESKPAISISNSKMFWYYIQCLLKCIALFDVPEVKIRAISA